MTTLSMIECAIRAVDRRRGNTGKALWDIQGKINGSSEVEREDIRKNPQ